MLEALFAHLCALIISEAVVTAQSIINNGQFHSLMLPFGVKNPCYRTHQRNDALLVHGEPCAGVSYPTRVFS